MRYCGPRGIPHSTFLGWSTADRDKALTWQRREDQTCKSCGTRHEEWDPEDGGRPDVYRAVAVQCPGCAAIARIQEVLTEDDGLGTKVQLWPREYHAAVMALRRAQAAEVEDEGVDDGR